MSKRIALAEKLLGYELYKYQKAILLCKAHKRIILKSRQIGLSTLMAVEALVDALTTPNTVILLLSIDERKSMKLLRDIRVYLSNMPNHTKFIGKTDTKTEIELDNGSRIISLTSNVSNARGYAADHLIFDEFGEMEDVDNLFAAALPTISRGGRVTILGTPRGKNKFWQLWEEGNGYERFEIPWWDCPALIEPSDGTRHTSPDGQWQLTEAMETVFEELSTVPGLFEQEHECSFETFSGSLWNWEELERLTLSEFSSKGGINYLAYDPAKVNDQSAVIVTNVKDGVKTVIYSNDLSEYDYPIQAEKVIELSKTYNVAKVVVDAGGVGMAVIDYLQPIRGKVVRKNFTSKFKEQMAVAIKSDCSKGNFFIVENKWARQLKQDLLNFDMNNTKFKHVGKSHQDFLAALMLCYSVVNVSRGQITNLSWSPRQYRSNSKFGRVGVF